ncbi:MULTISPECIES: tRNA lysidine(34) synthetase TilS [unclassified Mucilaginibacter]|uniref:tRNA lysidine(34) synthetase TilS n=1 Tax=unclassified Mucilaginibacter TaxID=2617802 RepID=UPI002AC9109F|nr:MULTISPECIES: tRNA lysidine(34) synthetase TilS [unclassified Mucilaginibacter]MEB0261645.1 tRNA lysidine(34) synthetase TilS [Mucilaginibacter sp. 10I4]MEB0278510.1 tRNA lysidine(34) synthetase TilS [Mucilaginibacter sp. 10B2]MEB0300730.1 tRNA lysidine(34) synthetase TilS [Mucilaginibacter sp. 5C4]WPX23534.1 tRNA lysidine(34) synthetase TilS [Mucilaginibacter sp. 5C4]
MLPVKRFVDFIEQNSLFTPANNILAAVSGGMDSVLMAYLLKAAGYNFSIAHCNFMLRGADADADQEFTRQLAQQLGVSFHTIKFDTQQYTNNNKISIQMAARDLRYNWFNQISQSDGYDTIALAHHQNDTIETILLNLTRGTGIAGLHGILPKNGRLVRPLLFLTRDEIQTIITAEGLKYVEDASNASTKYARNKIRHQVVPLLKELNPNLEATFENNLRNFRDLEVLMNDKVEALKKELLVHHEDEVHIAIDKIKELSPQRLLLFKLLQGFGFIETVVDDLLTALDKHAGRVFESPGYSLGVDRGRLIISPKNAEGNVEVSINQNDTHVVYGNYKLNLLHDDSALIVKNNPLAVSVDAALLVYPLTVRAWQQGDVFYPLGMKTRQKLSDFFIHQKVPLHKKRDVPVLVNGNGNIIWVGGYRLDERYKVEDNTKKVTIFELFKL